MHNRSVFRQPLSTNTQSESYLQQVIIVCKNALVRLAFVEFSEPYNCYYRLRIPNLAAEPRHTRHSLILDRTYSYCSRKIRMPDLIEWLDWFLRSLFAHFICYWPEYLALLTYLDKDYWLIFRTHIYFMLILLIVLFGLHLFLLSFSLN